MSGYEDILSLPHHRSASRAHMSQLDRAAQFAPFAALSGYEGEIAEAGRLTASEVELTDWAVEQIDQGLREIRRKLKCRPEVELTYFIPDQRKAGGAYHTITARAQKFLEPEGMLLLEGEIRIPLNRIVALTVR